MEKMLFEKMWSRRDMGLIILVGGTRRVVMLMG